MALVDSAWPDERDQAEQGANEAPAQRALGGRAPQRGWRRTVQPDIDKCPEGGFDPPRGSTTTRSFSPATGRGRRIAPLTSVDRSEVPHAATTNAASTRLGRQGGARIPSRGSPALGRESRPRHDAHQPLEHRTAVRLELQRYARWSASLRSARRRPNSTRRRPGMPRRRSRPSGCDERPRRGEHLGGRRRTRVERGADNRRRWATGARATAVADAAGAVDRDGGGMSARWD